MIYHGQGNASLNVCNEWFTGHPAPLHLNTAPPVFFQGNSNDDYLTAEDLIVSVPEGVLLSPYTMQLVLGPSPTIYPQVQFISGRGIGTGPAPNVTTYDNIGSGINPGGCP
jgi:hypothetical protein